MMKTILTSLILFLLYQYTHAQNYSKIDRIVELYPKSQSQEKLAERICNDFEQPDERVRAIYTWIARNVKYDTKKFYSKKKHNYIKYKTKEEKQIKEKKLEDKVAKKTISSHKAVCYGYSVLFQRMCVLCDIQCKIITGASKTKPNQIGKKPRYDHAWNAVLINNEWKMIDVTWGAGYVNEKEKKFYPSYTDTYFFTEPKLFALKHFPQDSTWALSGFSKTEFTNQPLYYSAFMSSEIDNILPEKGIINIGPKESIVIRISDNKYWNSVTYSFSKGKFSHECQPEIVDNNYCEFHIPNNGKSNEYLTLFINNNAIICYKIIIKK
ncbi:MAG: transglutaminase domain-containing protein [Breznakibacter sp.]